MTKRVSVALAVAGAGDFPVVGGGLSGSYGVRPPYGPPEGAVGPPNAGCPKSAGWFLVTPSGPEHLSAAYDFNYDNRVCARFLPDGSGAVTFMDNVVR